MVTLTIDRGDRLTLTITREKGEDPAGPIQVAVSAGDWLPDDWATVQPVDADADPTTYELVIAHGAETDFPDAHPAGTIVITAPVRVWTRPLSGDIDVTPVAWVTPR